MLILLVAITIFDVTKQQFNKLSESNFNTCFLLNSQWDFHFYEIFRKAFNGEAISEISYSQNGRQFSDTKARYFSVWQKGQTFTNTN